MFNYKVGLSRVDCSFECASYRKGVMMRRPTVVAIFALSMSMFGKGNNYVAIWMVLKY